MKRNSVFFAVLLLLSLTLSGCGSSAANGAASADTAVSSVPSEAEAQEYGITGGGESTSTNGSSVYRDENAKVIRTADLSFQTTEFDKAIESLYQLVESQGGYFEVAERNSGGYYSSSNNRWANFTIRIPKENYTSFISAVGQVAHLVSSSEGTEDVGEAYYDTELRLTTLKTKHERLLALLDKATKMEDIISLESALSDVEYEIQQYSSTLTRYDSLIDYTTIHLDLSEVTRISDSATDADPLSARIGAAFSKGWNNFLDGMSNLAVWMAYHFIGLVVFVIIAVGAVFIIRRRILPTSKTNKVPTADPDNKE